MKINWTSARVITLGYAGAILLGTLLLMLPFAHTNGQWQSFTDAFFTATSAVCVTGLVVVDTGTYYSLFGQLVIISLIQIGGLGIVTVAALVLVGLGKRVSYSQRNLLTDSFNLDATGGVIRLLLRVIKLTLAIEGVGALLLTYAFHDELGWGKAAYYGVFHAISAFCNAGFDLFGGYRNLTGYRGDILVNLVITSLVILGGLGFPVLVDCISYWRGKRRLLFHSRVVLAMTLLLIVFGMLAFFISEYNGVLSDLSSKEKLLSTYFQAVTPRTAGFNTVDMASLNTGTLLLITFLMFVGASPISTGGGVKTTTFAAMILNTVAVVSGEKEIRFTNRSIDHGTVLRSLALVLLAVSLIYIVTTIMSVIEPVAYERILFEVTSAFATVGLSTGLTPQLSIPSRYLLAFTMYVGRIGPLTLMLALAERNKRRLARLPVGRLYVG